MFEDSLIESAGRGRGKKSLGFTLVSFFLQACLLGVLILIPLIYTEALPKQQLMGFLVAPPPPPPPSSSTIATFICVPLIWRGPRRQPFR